MVDLFSYKEALHLIRNHISGYLMVYASTGAPNFPKNPNDYWNGGKVDQAAWDIILKDVMAKDFEDHVPKVCRLTLSFWPE